MRQIILTAAGELEIEGYFDGIFGPDGYDLGTGICEVIEHGDQVVGAGHYYGGFSYECTDTNGCPRLLYLYEGTHYATHDVGGV